MAAPVVVGAPAPVAAAPVVVAAPAPAPVVMTQPVKVAYGAQPAAVVIQQPVMHMRDKGPNWGHGTCGCFSNCWPTCIIGWCCPAIAFGKVFSYITTGKSCLMYSLIAFAIYWIWAGAQNIGYATGQYTCVNSAFGTTVCYYQYDYWYIGLSWAMSMVWLVMLVYLRGKFRAVYGLPGSGIQDCCCMWWCSWCELCRMMRFAYSGADGVLNHQEAAACHDVGVDPEIGGMAQQAAPVVMAPAPAPVMVAAPAVPVASHPTYAM